MTRGVTVIYSPKYLQYFFGLNHPFWSERVARFLKEIENAKMLNDKCQIREPDKATDAEILLVHTAEYLRRVKQLAEEKEALSVDTWLTPDNLEAAYYYVGGTILASQLALEGKKVINTLGGLHHAETNDSSGFCIFNDHAIAIRKLQKEKKMKKAAVVDVDVHAGNGTQEIFYADPTVLKISIHQDPATLYPGTGFAWQTGEGAGKGYTINIPLPPGTGEEEFLAALDGILPKVAEYRPDIIIVILGVDTYKEDPLASFQLEVATYEKIGHRLADLKNVVTLCAGGYSRMVPKLWLSYLRGWLS